MDNICNNCDKIISPERLNAIINLKLNHICTECSKDIKAIKGIYLGEAGTSPIVFTDKISMESGIYRQRYIEPDDEENTFGLIEEKE